MQNNTTSATYLKANPKKNGLKCPVCKSDLCDTYPNVILTSDPAQKNTNCSKCDYKGYRFV